MREHAYARIAKSSMLISVIAILRDRVVDVLVIGYSCRVPYAGQREPCAGLWASMCRPAGFHVAASGLPCASQRASMCRPAKIYVRRVMARRCLRMKKRTHFTVGPFELKLTHVSS